MFVARLETDMGAVRYEFQNFFKKTLEKHIQVNCK